MPENDNNANRNMHLEIGSIHTRGHVVIANGNASVRGHTRDDDQETQIITVGGVQTTPEAYDSLKESLTKIDKAIEEADLPEEDAEAAKANAQNLKEQMTSESKPNGSLLVQASEQLIKYGPRIAGTIIGLFTNPLAGEIVELAGERAIKFYKELRVQYPELFRR